jgi:hypothetical protein
MISARSASGIPVLDNPFGPLNLDLLSRVQREVYADADTLIIFVVYTDFATEVLSDC